MSNPLGAAIKYDVIPGLQRDFDDLQCTIENFVYLKYLVATEEYDAHEVIELVRSMRMTAKQDTPEKRGWIRVETWLEGYLAGKNSI